MISIHRSIRKALLGLALAVASTGGVQASTVDVTVDNQIFTIGTIDGSFNANASLLQSQPWWGDQQLAIDLRDAVGAESALEDGFGSGPFFAYSALPTVVTTAAFINFGTISADDAANVFRGSARNFAIAESVAPIPLPPAAFLLLGGLGALGLLKRQRA